MRDGKKERKEKKRKNMIVKIGRKREERIRVEKIATEFDINLSNAGI